MKFRAPAIVQLRRAQLILMLAVLIPTILLTSVGIILLAVGSEALNIVAGVLVLAFCTSATTGYILGSIFVSRGVSLARVQNDFLSSVSHELRTPITSTRMFIETLREGRVTDPQERKKCLDLLQQEMFRLERLVERLIELSRYETGRSALRRDHVVMADLVRDALAAFDAATIGQPMKVEVDLEPGLAVIGDRESLASALLNLLTNAWKHAGADRKIAIVAESRGRKQVEVAVLDNGPGIPREEQTSIFGQFERGSSARQHRIAGSGLGLSIVTAIATAHGGRVELSSGPTGSRFSILLQRSGPKRERAAKRAAGRERTDDPLSEPS